MSSYNFKDSLTIDNNKYLKWLNSSGTTRSSVIAVDTSNNVNLNSANGQLYVNSNNIGSNTFINVNNNNNVFVGSKLGVGFSATSNVSACLTIAKNNFIGVNTTRGTSDGYLGLSSSHTLSNTSGSRIVLYGIDTTAGNNGVVGVYAGNHINASIGLFTGNDSLKFSIANSGLVTFTPDGTTIRCSISDTSTSFNHTVVLTSTANSTSSTSGALQIAGGIGIQGNCNIDGTLSINNITGNINFNSSQSSTSYTTGAIYISGGLGISNSTLATSVTSGGGISIAGGIAVGKNAFVGGDIVVLSSTASISSQTGSLVLYGGLGVNEAIFTRNNNVPQIRVAPTTNGLESSIGFYSTNNFASNLTGASTLWEVGQNVGNIGSGNFGIWNSQTNNVITMSFSGNVGIQNSSPSSTLDVRGTLQVSSSITTGNIILNGTTLQFNATTANTQVFVNIQDNQALRFGANSIGKPHVLVVGDNFTNGGRVSFRYSRYSSWDWVDGTVSSVRMLIATNGSLGIGTSSPSYALDLFGDAIIRNTTDSSDITNGGSLTVLGGLAVNKSVHIGGPGLKIPSGDTASRPSGATRGYIRYNTDTLQFEGYGEGSWGSLGGNSSGGVTDQGGTTKILAELSPGSDDRNLRFITSNSERMRINSSGNIGISTSSPTYTLDINGTLKASSVIFNSTTQSTGIGTGGCLTVLGGTSISKDLYVGGTVTSSSDIRLKTNIRDLLPTHFSVLDFIDSVRTIKYNYINDSEQTDHIGFVAQDFQEAFPELLRKPQDGYYTLDYQKITVILLECIRELKSKIK